MAGTRKCWTNQISWILPSGMDSARSCVIYFTKLIEDKTSICMEVFFSKKQQCNAQML